MKFKIRTKGTITQGFKENLNPLYASQGLAGHTGIDWNVGYGGFVNTDNAGFVYKTYAPQERADNWTAVYLLVPNGATYMEVCLGHLSKLYAHEGDTLLENQLVGLEGNFGEVYQGGQRITPEMQDAGDKRGAHVHENYRPVERVKKQTKGKHYLNGKNGIYKDKEGFYYEIVIDNSVNGCVDPMKYVYQDSRSEILLLIKNLFIKLIK
jgi:hypothetical protein